MSIAEAISQLRQKLDYTQRQFAQELKVTPTSVSRFENGREPGPKVLKRLSELARNSGLPDLKTFFEHHRRANIIPQSEDQIDKLASAGAARRIPFDEISTWARILHDEVYWGIIRTIRSMRAGTIKAEDLPHALVVFAQTAEWVRDEMNLYITGVRHNDVTNVYGSKPLPSLDPIPSSDEIAERLQEVRHLNESDLSPEALKHILTPTGREKELISATQQAAEKMWPRGSKKSAKAEKP